jgi:penicillin-binding protein A
MNRPIARLFVVIVALFALLVVFTSRWTVIQASSLNKNSLNARPLIDALSVQRGRILAADGTVLARSVPAGDGTWKSVFPTGALFAQAVGYDLPAQGRAAGLELSDDNYLRGVPTGLASVFGQLSSRQVGDDVYTSLDPRAQRVAEQAMAGQDGSVVALDPRSGALKVMFSLPSYDDNAPDANGPGLSTFNRATQGSYSPGSTFKVVTATAGIDSARFTPSSIINGNSPLIVSGVPLSNDGNQSWGPITLTTALTFSVNTVFAQVAQRVGRATLTGYMKRFGFYRPPPLDYPANEMRASDVVSPTTGKPLAPGSPDEDLGRIGIGQGGLAVTPMQMAMVAAAVANGGTLMTPHMTDKVVNQDGQTVQTVHPSVYARVMSASTARQIAQMMTRVVDEGTGTEVQLGGGLSVAGKTGTASIGLPGQDLTNPWFIAFAPVDDPRVAIAVTVDRSQGGFGGSVAAPIVKAVLQTLLAEGQ